MVLIYIQNWDGKFKKLSYELVSYGSALAELAGTEAVALSIGEVNDEELSTLGKYGVSKVISVKKAPKVFDNKIYSQIFAEVATKLNANICLFAHNNEGKGLAPRISAKFKTSPITSVAELPQSISPFVVRKKVFTGKVFADIKINSDVKVLTLAQNSFEIKENAKDVEIEQLEINTPESNITVVEQNKVSGQVLLTDAEIVVSGGRGMKSSDNWGGIEELAELLNAGTACSRPVSDEGWRPHHEHVGQTGKIIAPNLYFAFGISGAIQHLGGVNNSKCIVAVNTDKDAPIFEAADYGIVGDINTVLPELLNEIKKVK